MNNADIEIPRPERLETSFRIFVDQAGYLPTAEKAAVFTFPAGYYSVINEKGSICFSGVPVPAGADEASGETLFKADFSRLTAPGTYRIISGTDFSPVFRIGEDVYKTVSVLSGGERARLTLCKLILSRMNLLILDEPTNHLDIDSREALEGALSAFDGTVIAVSHDRYFIEKLATRILEIAPGHGISGTVSGSGSDFTDYRVTHPGTAYTEYRQFMEARQSGSVAPSRMGIPSAGVPDAAPDEPSSSREAYLQARQSAAEQRKRRHRLERLRAESATLEADIDRLTAEINGDAATDFLRVAALDTEKTQKEDRLLAVYEEIEELESALRSDGADSGQR